MSITRLQQARQMYALGKLVERVGFQGGGRDDGEGSGFGDGPSSSGGDNDRPTMADIAGPVSTTSSSPKGDEVDRPNPHTVSGTSKTSTVTGKQMQSAARDFVQTLNTNNAIRAAQTKTKFSPFDNFTPTFAPKKNPFSLGNIAKNIFLGVVAPQLLAGTKLGPAINTFNQVNRVAGLFNKNIDVKDTISNLFSGNKTSTSTSKSKSTSKNNTTNNGGGDGEGLASLNNQASGYDEYILLLQKLQSGNISDGERNRFNVLKNMLGI